MVYFLDLGRNQRKHGQAYVNSYVNIPLILSSS